MSNNPAGWTVKGVCSLIVDLQLGSVALADATHIGSFGHPEQGLKANRRSSRVQLCGLSDAKAAVSGAIWSLTAHHERLLLAGFCLSPPAALGSITAHRDRQKSADSVEKVGSSRPPTYCPLKMRSLRAATRNLSPKSSAESKDFNLKRVLFYRGNDGRLFQQNRPKAAGGRSDSK
ncbi:hypothetical protein [Pseudomonas putida]|uniref:hypothetical protein n=1 Tax=Pseudomonas putida TaxID=303 RepID=UPI0015C38309|nr:hypothetical protein [Pseudomonas putida]